MEKKSLYDISWQVPESEYREDKALSYSTLATFERGGFHELKHLFDRKETPSLTFGSAVDSIITGGMEEFNERFMVAEYPKISDTLITVVNKLFGRYNDIYISLDDIPDALVSQTAKECDFWAADKWDNRRAKEVRKEGGCNDYYKLLYVAKDKTVISTAVYQDVINSVEALKNSDATSYYFAPNNPFDNIERLYQLKFKANLNGINYRNMADLIIVNYDKKWVLPCDLKTSGHKEYDFYQSFKTWRYDIQARLYWRIIRDNLNRDNYFKDFTLLDYKFIVVNKENLDPMVWNFPKTKTLGTLEFKDGTIMRDPEDIGRELQYYLDNNPKRPMCIRDENNICEWLNKL